MGGYHQYIGIHHIGSNQWLNLQNIDNYGRTITIAYTLLNVQGEQSEGNCHKIHHFSLQEFSFNWGVAIMKALTTLFYRYVALTYIDKISQGLTFSQNM